MLALAIPRDVVTVTFACPTRRPARAQAAASVSSAIVAHSDGRKLVVSVAVAPSVWLSQASSASAAGVAVVAEVG
jgi:hypothetical protein